MADPRHLLQPLHLSTVPRPPLFRTFGDEMCCLGLSYDHVLLVWAGHRAELHMQGLEHAKETN
jgi:hypothetical protein